MDDASASGTRSPLSETRAVTARMDDGAEIVIRRWGEPAAERVVMSHGNGLAIDAFVRFGAALDRRFEIVAFDMRNHGCNPWRPVKGANWIRFIHDFPRILRAIDSTFGIKPTHGAFHSLSSVICLLHQGANAYPWQSLTLFEPPISPAKQSPLRETFLNYHMTLSQRAAKRRDIFETPDDLARSMRRSSLFGLVPSEDVDRLARATLRQRKNGQWQLCCPPEFEAETFLIDGVEDLRPGLQRINCPLKVVVGDHRIHYASILVHVGRELGREFGFDVVELKKVTHFMQFEAPRVCADLIGS